MFNFALEPFSFIVGVLAASLFWFLAGRAGPLWEEMRSGFKEQREVAQTRKSTSVEENHRRNTLRRAQGMHLAAPLFALDEIIQEPLLLIPPPTVEPGASPKFEDVVSQTIPYLPTWPEIAGVYVPQTLTVTEALSGDSNIVLIGQPGVGKTVALAHIASLAANRSEKLGSLQNSVPFLIHVAQLNLPLPDNKDPLRAIVDIASENAPMLDLGRMPGFIQGAFNSGQAILLVDGYDEIPPAEQQLVAEYLKAIMQAHPKARIVVTGAPEYLDGLIGLGFAPLSLMTWSALRVVRFMNRWGELWGQTVALEAWSQTGPGQVDSI